jgi:hypothetical protein
MKLFIEIFIPLLTGFILFNLVLLYYIKKKKYTESQPPLTNVTIVMSPLILKENPLRNIEKLKI